MLNKNIALYDNFKDCLPVAVLAKLLTKKTQGPFVVLDGRLMPEIFRASWRRNSAGANGGPRSSPIDTINDMYVDSEPCAAAEC